MSKETSIRTCTWVGRDPIQWTRIRKLLGYPAIAASAVSAYSWVWNRLFTDMNIQSLEWLRHAKIPPYMVDVSHFLWLVTIPLLFLAYVIRLFVYHSLRVMCPLATPTLSDRIAHSQLASGWLHAQTRRLHDKVKLLEQKDGLRFESSEEREFGRFLRGLAAGLQQDGALKQVIAITPVTDRVYEDPHPLNVWDPFFEQLTREELSARDKRKLKKTRRVYFVVDSRRTYDQNQYDPAMENITSALELVPDSVEARVLYGDGTNLISLQWASLKPFFDTYHQHYLVIETDRGWILCRADIGTSSGDFREAIVFEPEGPERDWPTNVSELRGAICDMDKAGQASTLWHVGEDEKGKRHVYLFDRMGKDDRAVFCDWEIAVGGWREDRLVQIRQATQTGIGRGLDIRRLFVVPKGNSGILQKAIQEALKQMPDDVDVSISDRFGYVEFPDDTASVWPELKHVVTSKIEKYSADFALYTFAEQDEQYLYVNNFDGATRLTATGDIEAATQAFNSLWDKRKPILCEAHAYVAQESQVLEMP